jgi:hypothetical protein
VASDIDPQRKDVRRLDFLTDKPPAATARAILITNPLLDLSQRAALHAIAPTLRAAQNDNADRAANQPGRSL